MYDGGGVLTTEEAMSWYIVLWSDGLEGSWTRPAPQTLTAPERKVMRIDFWCAMPCSVRMRYVRSRSWCSVSMGMVWMWWKLCNQKWGGRDEPSTHVSIGRVARPSS